MMNQLKHNKKRNIGLLNEFFARHLAMCVIDKKFNDIDKSKVIWKKYLSENTELFKESQIFDAIYNTRVSNKETAYSFLQNLKSIAVKQDAKKLNDEKTRLLHEIKNNVKDVGFFEREVTDYRTQATIQTLINCWRESSVNVEAVQLAAQLEDHVIQHLISQPILESKDASVLELDDQDISGLVFNIMLEKFNKIYGQALTEDQKTILNMYLFSTSNQNVKENLSTILENLRSEVLDLLQQECIANHNKLLVEKYTKVRNMLMEAPYCNITAPTNVLNDDMITFFMSVSKLREELMSENEITR